SCDLTGRFWDRQHLPPEPWPARQAKWVSCSVKGPSRACRLGIKLDRCNDVRCTTALPPKAEVHPRSCYVAYVAKRATTGHDPLPPGGAVDEAKLDTHEALQLAFGPGDRLFHRLSLHVADGHLGHHALGENLRGDLGRRGG